MKDFFSEYGWVVAVGVILVIVIAMQTPLGQVIQTQVTGFINKFAGNVNNWVG